MYLIVPSGHTTLKQCRFNVDSTFCHCVHARFSPDSATVLTEADFGENGFRSVVYDTSSTGQSSFLLTQKDNCYPFMDVSAAPSGPGKCSLTIDLYHSLG